MTAGSGLADRRPVALRELPAFRRDALDESISGGDLCVHVCADTPPRAEDALAALVAAGHPAARVRWSQRASMHRRPGERSDARPRNLLGFKDATANPRRGRDLERHVWVARGERTWMLGGTFLVVRRVRVLPDAHARVAVPRANAGATILRRGYSFDNGRDARGERDAGLLLLLFGRDPSTDPGASSTGAYSISRMISS